MKLRRHALGIYRRHLSHFLLFRLCKALFLAGLQRKHRLLSWVLRNPFSGHYSWLALSETNGYHTARFCLAPAETAHIAAPVFAGYGAEKAASRTPAREQPSPAVEVFEFSKAVIVGGLDFFFLSDKAIHHDLFAPGEHRCPAENFGIVAPSRNGSRVGLRLTKTALETKAGVSLLGQCSGNYAHWLTESLPKLATLDASHRFPALPLLIDAGLHPNILASIDLINFNRRTIMEIERWAPLRVDRLVTVSAPGYERYAPHTVSGREPAPYVNTFSRAALRTLREAAVRGLGDLPVEAPTEVYLSRSKASSNLRQIANADEIESDLKLAGIRTVRPDSMTFREQVEACRNARLIVGPVGASLANMIFAPSGCRIVCLAPYYDEASYFYYANLAGVLGHQIHFVLGVQTSTTHHPMHRSYLIPRERLLASLSH